MASTVTAGFTFDAGTSRGFNVLFAHAGSGTGFVCLGAKDSLPGFEPSEATGLPDSRGVNKATTAVSLIRYFLATRFTSVTVTFLIASMSSSGEVRPSTDSACDHSAARPAMEFLRNSASATSRRLVASTRSAGTPLLTYPSIIFFISATSAELSCPGGNSA